MLRLLEGYVRRVIYQDGNYRQVERGIGLGCPLSPLMGALYLQRLDEAFANPADGRWFYARFMDDWVILVPTRSRLRRVVRRVYRILGELKVTVHPDKTFVGRIRKGFDFLGYQFSHAGLGVASKTVRRCLEKASRLYEQGADAERIGKYLRQCWWSDWATDRVSR